MTPLRKKFLDSMQVRRFSPQTQRAYLYWLCELTRFTHCSPDRLADSDLKTFLWSLSLERNLSTSSCAQAFHAIKFFYHEVLDRSFGERLLPPMKRQQKIPELLSPLEVQQIFSACHKLKYLTIFELCYGCGLRVSEATSIAVQDIDGEQRVLHVHLGKGAKDRRVPLSDTLLKKLRRYWVEYRPRVSMFYGVDRANTLNVSSVQKVYKHSKHQASIGKNGGIHALRHAYATHQLMAGMPLTQLQYNLGHNDIRTTLHYVHWLPHYQAVQDEQFDLVGKLEQSS